MGAEHTAADLSPAPARAVHRPAVASVLAGPTPEAGGSRAGASPIAQVIPMNRMLGRSAILALQRSRGNAFVGQRLAELQRHPEGFTPTVDPAAAAEEIANPPPLAQAAGATDEAAAEPTAEGAEAAPPEAELASAPTEAATEEPTAGVEAAVSPATGKGDAKAPTTPTAMSLAKAEEVLTKSFGTVKKIVPGKIELLADRAALWVKYDAINKGRKNPYNGGKPWADGDAKTYIPGLDGTADPDTGIVYINQQTTLATATAHEVLHNNTAAGFRGAVGDTINEGTTEYLAIKALKAAGVSTASGTAYPGEVGFVTKLIVVVTEETLIKAYFGGAATLTDAFDKKQGAGSFAKLKPLAEAKNYSEAEKLFKAP